jgi:hypothetical protein
MTDWREAWPAGMAEDLVEDARSLGIRASPRMVQGHCMFEAWVGSSGEVRDRPVPGADAGAGTTSVIM